MAKMYGGGKKGGKGNKGFVATPATMVSGKGKMKK